MKMKAILFMLCIGALAQARSVDLSWTASTSPNVTYNVYRADVAPPLGNQTLNWNQIATGITGTTYTDTGVVSGMTYFYRVTAFDGSIESDYSNQTQAVMNPTAIGGTFSGTINEDERYWRPWRHRFR